MMHCNKLFSGREYLLYFLKLPFVLLKLAGKFLIDLQIRFDFYLRGKTS